MFHDPGMVHIRIFLSLLPTTFVYLFCSGLERTTDSKGKDGAFRPNTLGAKLRPVPGQIKEREWYGDDGMQHVRTLKEPKQSIPTFAETIALLMKVCHILPAFLLFSSLLELSNLKLCSLRTNMSSLTWMSRSRTTLTDSSR
jgi:hypothetical protein